MAAKKATKRKSTSTRKRATASKRTLTTQQIVNKALASGAIDKNKKLENVLRRMGPDIDQVAGYVLAWEDYVLVVGKQGALAKK